jgi:hypothetical protein
MVENSPACPCEGECPPGAPGAVQNNETVLRTVPVYEQLVFGPDGQPGVALTFFSRDELAGRNDKTVSVLREGSTSIEEIARRCVALTQDPSWQSDPVIAKASAEALRKIVDADNQREICVNADPTTKDNDKLGACPTHASILRAIAQNTKVPPRLSWGIIRAQLAERFSQVQHLSGHIPASRD